MANYSSKHYNEFASLIEDEFDIDRKSTTAEMCLRLFIPDNSKLVEFLGGDWDTVVRLADSHVL